MNLESIKNAGLNTVKTTQHYSIQTINWLGRNVAYYGGKAIDTVSTAGKTVLSWLTTLKNHIISFAKQLQSNIPVAFNKSKEFLILHKEAALGLAIGSALTVLAIKMFSGNVAEDPA
ncbi:MAG: hypothetical protein K1060chlam5_00797 [Candidatus Anoxychlamydiales bacterium]|nr:hypothetical protein [Candidatus Anoxychlamydiales bacterium]